MKLSTYNVCILQLDRLQQHKLSAASTTGSMAQGFQCSNLKMRHAGVCDMASRSQYSSSRHLGLCGLDSRSAQCALTACSQ